MDASELITLTRDLSHTNSTQFPDAKILTFLNRVKDDFFSYLITWVRENWNWDIWKTASVDDQTEYVLKEAASDTAWTIKIKWVSICYDKETYPDWTYKYRKMRLVSPSDLSENWNYYVNYQSKDDPIYYIADRSIFIAPSSKNWEWWDNLIELKGIKSIADYTDATTETNIKLPLYLHKSLVQWTLPYIHRAQWRKDEANFEQQVYEKERTEAVMKFSDRNNSSTFLTYPDDQYTSTYTINLN